MLMPPCNRADIAAERQRRATPSPLHPNKAPRRRPPPRMRKNPGGSVWVAQQFLEAVASKIQAKLALQAPEALPH